MTTEINLSDFLKQYIQILNQIEEFDKKYKQLKSIKTKYDKKLIDLLKQQNYSFKIDGFEFKLKSSNHSEGITQKYLDKTLKEYYNEFPHSNTNENNKLLEYLLSKRVISTKENLEIIKPK
tara:strand:+ start:3346 stop:3708 length:363 start_codon:yes stop_codon:yes gene_type:complete